MAGASLVLEALSNGNVGGVRGREPGEGDDGEGHGGQLQEIVQEDHVIVLNQGACYRVTSKGRVGLVAVGVER